MLVGGPPRLHWGIQRNSMTIKRSSTHVTRGLLWGWPPCETNKASFAPVELATASAHHFAPAVCVATYPASK